MNADIWLTVRDPEHGKFYKAGFSIRWLKRNSNGADVSIGYTVGEDLAASTFARMQKREITQEQWNHSGCQSRCTLRDNSECQW